MTSANDPEKKLDLVRRSLALKHKLKVHDSMPKPDTHEDLATYLLSRWELEDELGVIEEMIRDTRQKNQQKIRSQIEKKGLPKKLPKD